MEEKITLNLFYMGLISRDSGCTLLGLRLLLRLSDPGAGGFAAAGGINRLRLMRKPSSRSLWLNLPETSCGLR